jgi:hypothetical protein
MDIRVGVEASDYEVFSVFLSPLPFPTCAPLLLFVFMLFKSPPPPSLSILVIFPSIVQLIVNNPCLSFFPCSDCQERARESKVSFGHLQKKDSFFTYPSGLVLGGWTEHELFDQPHSIDSLCFTLL